MLGCVSAFGSIRRPVHLEMSLPFCCMAYTLLAAPDTGGCRISTGCIYAAVLQLSHLITCIHQSSAACLRLCKQAGLSPSLQVCMVTIMSLMPPTVLNPICMCVRHLLHE